MSNIIRKCVFCNKSLLHKSDSAYCANSNCKLEAITFTRCEVYPALRKHYEMFLLYQFEDKVFELQIVFPKNIIIINKMFINSGNTQFLFKFDQINLDIKNIKQIADTYFNKFIKLKAFI